MSKPNRKWIPKVRQETDGYRWEWKVEDTDPTKTGRIPWSLLPLRGVEKSEKTAATEARRRAALLNEFYQEKQERIEAESKNPWREV